MDRVWLLAMALDLGGAETHVVSLAGGLSRRGWDVTVFSGGGRLVERLREAGIRHREAPLKSRSPLRLRRAVRMMAAAFAAERPDVVHAHARIPAWVADTARRRAAPPPLVTTYHGIYNAGWFWRRFSRWGDRAVAVSPEVRDHLVRRLGAPAGRVSIVPNGIDTTHFRPASPEGAAPGAADRRAGGPRIVHVSRLDEVLAPALALCEAAVVLAERLPGVEVEILGGGRGLERVREAARSANSRIGREAVRLAGPTLDPVPHLLAADVAVAAGRAALEAMSCGKPVVVAGAGGLGGLVTPDSWRGLAATNFSGRRPGGTARIGGGEMARELDAALEPRAAGELGAFGRSLVLDNYSEDAMVDAILDVYAQAREECR